MKQERQKSLKPLLTPGQRVYSAYWDPSTDPHRKSDPQWYPGIISAYKVSKLPNDIKYGYVRYYNINFDDGDSIGGVNEHLVMDEMEYELSVLNDLDDEDNDDGGKKKGKGNNNSSRKKGTKSNKGWKGVKNVTDYQSADMWAKHVGWYVATLTTNITTEDNDNEGEQTTTVEHTFSLLSDALRAHDAHIVRTKGLLNIHKSDLNLPSDWDQLFVDQKKAKKINIDDEIQLQIKNGIRDGVKNATSKHKLEIDRVKLHLMKKYETDKDIAVSDAIQTEEWKLREERSRLKNELKLIHDGKVCTLKRKLDREKEEIKEQLLQAEAVAAAAAAKEAETLKVMVPKKLLFEMGDEVYAAWWPDNAKEEAAWFPGRVLSYYEVDPMDIEHGDGGRGGNENENEATTKGEGRGDNNKESPSSSSGVYYGPTRRYTVRYDEDGSELSGIPEEFVFGKADYLLSTTHSVSKTSLSSSSSKKNNNASSSSSQQQQQQKVKKEAGKYPAEEFGTGWTQAVIPRSYAASASKVSDTYYYSPVEQYKFRSRPEVTRFIVCLSKTNGDEAAAIELFRGKYPKGHSLTTTSTSVSTATAAPSSSSSSSTKAATTQWKGIKNVVDESSNDQWAKYIGWYEFDNVDNGERQIFSRLVDAIKAYDTSIVRAKGDKVKRNDLNLPDDWEWLFSKSGVVEPVTYTQEEYTEKLQQEKKKMKTTVEKDKALAVAAAVDVQVAAAIDAERKKHHKLRKQWKAATNQEKAQAIETARSEGGERVSLAMSEAKKAMNSQMIRSEMALKEATVLHNLQMDKLQHELQQQHEHEKEQALYWLRVEMEQADQEQEQEQQQQIEPRQRANSQQLAAELAAAVAEGTLLPSSMASMAQKQRLKPDESSSAKKNLVRSGSASLSEPPLKRTKLVSTTSDGIIPQVATATAAAMAVAFAEPSHQQQQNRRPSSITPTNLPSSASELSSSQQQWEQQQMTKKTAVDQVAGETTTEEKKAGGHQDAVEALLQYAEKLDSEEEDGSVHSKNEGGNCQHGFEAVSLSIIMSPNAAKPKMTSSLPLAK